MQSLHVGSGNTRGAMTIFPIWGDFAHVPRLATTPASLAVSERASGAKVGSLVVRNNADTPVLVFEGQILEGGWQNRMVAQSFIVGPRSNALVEVVCVEQGRWGGGRHHRSIGRRASGRVRSGLRDGQARQESVWNRVHQYEASLGETKTSSFTEHAERTTRETGDLSAGLRALPGQIGVVVAMSGQPLFAEVFSDHETLRREFASIVRAAGLDAIGQPLSVTPSRRARRFVDRASRVFVQPGAAAGLGRAIAGRDEYAQVSGVRWNNADAHLVLTNPRHELSRVSA